MEALAARIVEDALEAADFETILGGFCEALADRGVRLLPVHVALRAFHPEFGSVAFRWRGDEGTRRETSRHVNSPQTRWRQSPFYFLLPNDVSEIRHRLSDKALNLYLPCLTNCVPWAVLNTSRSRSFLTKYSADLAVGPNNSPDGMLISLTCDDAAGFRESDLAAVRGILPVLALALKSNANRQMAEDIATTYLGRDAGLRVLSGDIQRGSVRRVDTVIWYFDLTGFTKLSEALSGREIVDMLNDYFEVAVNIVQARGGNVLKFMGDGILAIFDFEKVEKAGAVALDAVRSLDRAIAGVNRRRTDEGLMATDFTLALHAGEVLHGNIGGTTRLDFTVIGAAVNTAARLSGMCAHVDQKIVISAGVARPLLAENGDLVSLGQYRLRGVAERQELFTL